jgi:hypothetical protein
VSYTFRSALTPGNVFEMLRICKMGEASGGAGTSASPTVKAGMEAAFEIVGCLPGGGACRLRLADLAQPRRDPPLAVVPNEDRRGTSTGFADLHAQTLPQPAVSPPGSCIRPSRSAWVTGGVNMVRRKPVILTLA